jgi:hypothetical protein
VAAAASRRILRLISLREPPAPDPLVARVVQGRSGRPALATRGSSVIGTVPFVRGGVIAGTGGGNGSAERVGWRGATP